MNEDMISGMEKKQEQTDHSMLTLHDLIEALGDQDFILYVPYIGGEKRNGED